MLSASVSEELLPEDELSPSCRFSPPEHRPERTDLLALLALVRARNGTSPLPPILVRVALLTRQDIRQAPPYDYIHRSPPEC